MDSINDKVIRLLKSGLFTHELAECEILAHKDLIHEISTLCKETGIFKHSLEKYEECKKMFKDDKIRNAYMWFLNRICTAPTDLHRDCSVRWCLPIVDDFIQEKFATEGKNEEEKN